jgi:uncharacterized protein with HEPN domain
LVAAFENRKTEGLRQFVLDARTQMTANLEFARNTFETDEEIMDAVIHNLTVIGEAANHIPSEITESHPDIPLAAYD